MNTQVEFLLLHSSEQLIRVALRKLAELYQSNERILVLADKRSHLEQMDEWLWHNSDKQFIAYSLDSECYANTTAVLLTDDQPGNIRYQVLLNMGEQLPDKPEQFRTIIELVDNDENSIENAREHYKIYRHLGSSISHQQLTSED